MGRNFWPSVYVARRTRDRDPAARNGGNLCVKIHWSSGDRRRSVRSYVDEEPAGGEKERKQKKFGKKRGKGGGRGRGVANDRVNNRANGCRNHSDMEFFSPLPPIPYLFRCLLFSILSLSLFLSSFFSSDAYCLLGIVRRWLVVKFADRIENFMRRDAAAPFHCRPYHVLFQREIPLPPIRNSSGEFTNHRM